MTIYIIILTVIVSYSAFQKPDVFNKFQFNPYAVNKHNQQYRFLSHALVHADWPHLIINMFVLYFFGPVVESFMKFYFGDGKGIMYFLLLYLGGAAAACLPTFSKQKNNPYYNSVGASGAISALVFSFIVFAPLQEIRFYGILPMPGIVFGIIYLVAEYYMGKRGGTNINHDAHFMGAVYGALFTIAIRPALAMEFVEQIMYRFQ